MRLKLILFTVAAVCTGVQLAGCASVDIRAGGGAVSGSATQVQVSTGSVGAALIVGILVADSARYFFRGPDGTRTPMASPAAGHDEHSPPRVSVQDCTRPVDPGAGNLFCRSPQSRD